MYVAPLMPISASSMSSNSGICKLVQTDRRKMMPSVIVQRTICRRWIATPFTSHSKSEPNPSETGLLRADSTSATSTFNCSNSASLAASSARWPLSAATSSGVAVGGLAFCFASTPATCALRALTSSSSLSRRGLSVRKSLFTDSRLFESTIAAPSAVPVPMPSSTSDEAVMVL